MNFYSQNGFCSHFHNFYPFLPLFYMKLNNVHWIFSTNLTNIHKRLEKILFSRRSESKKNPTKKEIQFDAKKVLFLSIYGCWSNWWKKFGVHCWTSCKIMAQTDKYCGNESIILSKSKNPSFYALFLPFKLLTKKHANLSNLLSTPEVIF